MKRFVCVMGTILVGFFFFALASCLTVDNGGKQRESDGSKKTEIPKDKDEGASKGQHKY